jgi:hypothetical protein
MCNQKNNPVETTTNNPATYNVGFPLPPKVTPGQELKAGILATNKMRREIKEVAGAIIGLVRRPDIVERQRLHSDSVNNRLHASHTEGDIVVTWTFQTTGLVVEHDNLDFQLTLNCAVKVAPTTKFAEVAGLDPNGVMDPKNLPQKFVRAVHASLDALSDALFVAFPHMLSGEGPRWHDDSVACVSLLREVGASILNRE